MIAHGCAPYPGSRRSTVCRENFAATSPYRRYPHRRCGPITRWEWISRESSRPTGAVAYPPTRWCSERGAGPSGFSTRGAIAAAWKQSTRGEHVCWCERMLDERADPPASRGVRAVVASIGLRLAWIALIVIVFGCAGPLASRCGGHRLHPRRPRSRARGGRQLHGHVDDASRGLGRPGPGVTLRGRRRPRDPEARHGTRHWRRRVNDCHSASIRKGQVRKYFSCSASYRLGHDGRDT